MTKHEEIIISLFICDDRTEQAASEKFDVCLLSAQVCYGINANILHALDKTKQESEIKLLHIIASNL